MRTETFGDATLILGDCRDVLPTLGRFDLLLTDPPYGIKRFQKGFGKTRFIGHGVEAVGIKWDVAPGGPLLSEIMSTSAESIIWGYNNLDLPNSEHFLVWDKEQTVDNFASAEIAFANVKKPSKVFRYAIHRHNHSKNGGHPTEKPVRLMKWCILQAAGPHSVLDPFMGSGTTGVAAIEMGRQFTGIEREEKYFDIACRRIEAAAGQGKLFGRGAADGQ